MKYTKATNYALHTILYMIENAKSKKLSVYALAKHFNVSDTYLSKILTQLVKAGIIDSTSGANGGYFFSKKVEEISFMDIINAVEGNFALFKCEFNESKCPIHKVMVDAEKLMESYLQNKKIYELAHEENFEVNEE